MERGVTCFFCGRQATDRHHIFGGANRAKSEKYKLIVYLCRKCHDELHFGKRDKMDYLHQYGQRLFNTLYPNLNFRSIFGRNYLDNENETL